MLDVVSKALKRVQSSYKASTERTLKSERKALDEQKHQEQISERIDQGTWHDGRVDCICGNGIMSELGMGDEPFSVKDAEGRTSA